jgi:ABC-type transport system involved in multi-copper enzyme maturation permease subunit
MSEGEDETSGREDAMSGLEEEASTGRASRLREAFRRMEVVLDREFDALRRSRSMWLLSAGYAAVVLALTWAGGPGGYLPAVLDLLAPLQLLVPVLAVGFGYRAVLGDADREELSVLRTFPVGRRGYLLGTYLGRLAALLAVVVAPLVLAGAWAGVAGGAQSEVLASYAGRDSPAVLFRLLVLTALYAATTLAAAVALSALATGPRAALALGVGLVVLVGVGLDLGLVALLAGDVLPAPLLSWLLALSPASAFRALVLSFSTGSATPGPAVAATGLLVWLGGSLGVALAALPRFADR